MIHYITSDGLGQPWVGNELRIVTHTGIPVVLHAMRSPTQLHFESPWAQGLARETKVLYPLPVVGMVISLLVAPFLFRSRWAAALTNAVLGQRENLRARVSALAHFFVACHWARGLRGMPVSHIHSQWAYSSGTIGMYGAWLLGKSFSFTGHAADLFRDRVALRDKVRRAAFIVCISEFHRQFFLSEGARPDQLRLVYCGIDVTKFFPQSLSPVDQVLKIRSSGRLVEKKGFEYLIDACSILRQRGIVFDCVIAGSGPLEQELRDQVNRQKLDDQVTITGAAI
ncbi:glycosyltransferase, partial [Flavobacterium sp.]|uniref:glycosyltransferase n=1 Tax=Flavobacterium sp. TaxID=239 RepID=UPI00374DBD21